MTVPPDVPRSLDWSRAHARLAAAEAALADGLAPDPAVLAQVLDQRARALAQVQVQEAPQSFVNLVVFTLGDDRFAVPTDRAEAVIEMAAITPVPGLPDIYPGIVLHRGAIFPVLHLGLLFDRPGAAEAACPYGVLVQQDGQALALAASGIDGVSRVENSGFAPCTDEGMWHHVVEGTTQEGAIVLDVQRLFADARLIVHQK